MSSDDSPRTHESSRDDTAIQDGDGRKKAVTDVTIGVMNCQSMCNKLDFIFDHVQEYGLDIVALTETWLSNQEPRNKFVIDQCEAKGYILHHIPRSSGRKGGTYVRAHPLRKQIQVRALRRINDVALNDDLAGIEIDTKCGDVNTVAIQYDDCLRKLLDKHAPLKTIQVVERPLNNWINDDILALKIIRRKNESLWRRTIYRKYYI